MGLYRPLSCYRARTSLFDGTDPADRRHALSHAPAGFALRFSLRSRLRCSGRLHGTASALFYFLPAAVAMAFEMATYGLLAGVLYRTFPKTVPCLYGALLAAMAGGRVVWGAVQFLFSGLFHTGFSFSAFLAGAVTQAVPGILLQILLVPALVLALKRAKLLF